MAEGLKGGQDFIAPGANTTGISPSKESPVTGRSAEANGAQVMPNKALTVAQRGQDAPIDLPAVVAASRSTVLPDHQIVVARPSLAAVGVGDALENNSEVEIAADDEGSPGIFSIQPGTCVEDSSPGEDIPFPDILRDRVLNTAQEALLKEQWQEFNRVRGLSVSGNRLLEQAEADEAVLPRGTLLHGTTYSQEKMLAIKQTGILSGEFVGIPEIERETSYCADFFRVPQDMTVTEYQAWTTEMESRPGSRMKKRRMETERLATPNSKGTQITFIVDAQQPEIADLLKQDAYGENADPEMSSINKNLIPYAEEDQNSRRLSAILVGLPSSGINGIILGTDITEEDTGVLRETFGTNVALFTAEGTYIKPPSINS